MRFHNTMTASFAALALLAGSLSLGCGSEDESHGKAGESHGAEAHGAPALVSTAGTGAGIGTGEMTGTGAGRMRSNTGVSGIGESAAATDGGAKKTEAPSPTSSPAHPDPAVAK